MNNPERPITEPLYAPLTRRVMMGGIPMEVWLFFLLFGMQLMNFRVYWALLLLPLLWWVLKQLYLRDEWGPGAWMAHLQSVARGTTRMDV